tara:strand:+ start:25371 stop:25916 length:546 start_codon:yes stop_codon:yes gene_type:complete
MKKLILIFLFIPIVFFGQTDFRKMNWQDNIEDLKMAYPEVRFEKVKEQGIDLLMHTDYLIGIETSIVYAFSEDKLIAGFYAIDPLAILKKTKERLKDFYNISERLNDKYDMERSDEWLVTTWKDEPNHLDHAIDMGDVELIEKSEVGKTYIIHTLNKNDHSLVYASAEWFEIMQQEQADDF